MEGKADGTGLEFGFGWRYAIFSSEKNVGVRRGRVSMVKGYRVCFIRTLRIADGIVETHVPEVGWWYSKSVVVMPTVSSPIDRKHPTGYSYFDPEMYGRRRRWWELKIA